MLNRLKNALDTIRRAREEALVRPLPTTDAAVEDLIERAIAATGLDTKNDSLRNAVATTLLSLPQGTTTIRVRDLKNVINQARCKQASYNLIEAIRKRDKEAREAAEQKTDS